MDIDDAAGYGSIPPEIYEQMQSELRLLDELRNACELLKEYESKVDYFRNERNRLYKELREVDTTHAEIGGISGQSPSDIRKAILSYERRLLRGNLSQT